MWCHRCSGKIADVSQSVRERGKSDNEQVLSNIQAAHDAHATSRSPLCEASVAAVGWAMKSCASPAEASTSACGVAVLAIRDAAAASFSK